MKPELKNAAYPKLPPYLLFVYLFDKIGQAVRLSPGTDLFRQGAFPCRRLFCCLSQTRFRALPLWICLSVLWGLSLSGLWCTSKVRTRKYRKGIEYGSARWGNAEDIKPYTDPVFQNNVLLTQTERLTMNSRPKQPKYARNKNILVIGGSGSGKTRFFVKPT